MFLWRVGKMNCEIFITGIGGEGVLTIGEMLANCFIKNNFKVSLYPFYGSQQRGGEVNCILKIDSNDNIINPTINSPDYFLVVNDKYIEKYEKFKNGKTVIINVDKKDIHNKMKNMILLRKFIESFAVIDKNDILDELKKKFKKNEVFEKNLEVFNNIGD